MSKQHTSQCKKLLSIVTPCFNEEDNVEICYQTIKQIIETSLPEYDYEHVFCDNASTDDTLKILHIIAEQDKRVKVIVNSRNFGPFNSLFNGVVNTSGDAVITFMPADLQDPPELIPDFVKKWEQGYEVVYGIRQNREETLIMRMVRKLYYRVAAKMANIETPIDVGEYQLVDRVVIDSLRSFEDYYPYLRGMIANCGFRSTGIGYTWKRRKRGFSKNNFYALIDQGLNGMISFTNVPMRLCMFLGVVLSFLSIVYAFINLLVKIFHSEDFSQPGIATLIIAIFFFSGVQLLFLGIIGEYISAIHFQVRKRPLVIERQRINF